jgi:hypothetical protein
MNESPPSPSPEPPPAQVSTAPALGDAPNAAALSAANRKLSTANRNLTASHSRAQTLESEYSAEKSQAQQATATANASASASYAARNAALAARSESLDQRARAISTEEGQIQSSTISADGVYVVGKDIPSGTYHTTGDGGQTDNECYFATLASSNTQDISDNNNFDGPETVDVSGAYAFQISGPCTWVKAG